MDDDFAEGIAVVEERLIQLSWKSSRARIYSLAELDLVGQISYEGEGWGLCSTDRGLAMSDGTSRVLACDHNLRVQHSLRVRSHGVPLLRINDLEYASGLFFANVWFTSDVYVFSAATGTVVAIVDCSALEDEQPRSGNPEQTMNGIAHNPEQGTFFVTGKLWSYLYEIRLPGMP